MNPIEERESPIPITAEMKEAAEAIGSKPCYNAHFIPLAINAATIDVVLIDDEEEDEEATKLLIQTTIRREAKVKFKLHEHAFYRVLDHLFPKKPSLYAVSDADPTIATWLDNTIETALERHATDLHIEQREGSKTSVLIRVDRGLRELEPLSEELGPRAINAVRRKAQLQDDEPLAQGSFDVITRDGRKIQCRVQMLPDHRGADAILRFNGSALRLYKLTELGMDPDVLQNLHDALNSPGGVHALSGPMNSGKTTSRHSMTDELLDLIGRPHRAKGVSAEDPVEIPLKNTTQTPINEAKGITYAAMARAYVRSDADVVGIAEVRDAETAEACFNLGQTGRHVLMTLHAIDAIAAIDRLLQLRVSAEQLDATLRTVLSQRMLPLICQDCRTKRLVTASERYRLADVFKNDQIPREVWDEGPGCGACNGYGRVGQVPVFELLVVTRTIGSMIRAGASYAKLREEALRAKKGYIPMAFSALGLVSTGKVTLNKFFQEVYTA